MRIALNALALRPDGAGVSTYIREVVRAMEPEVRASLRAVVQRDALGELPDDVECRSLPTSSGVVRAAMSAAVMPRADVLHGLDVDLPVGRRGPMVTTVHDMAVFDVPWAFSPVRVRGERVLIRHALGRADVITADSDFTAERVQALSGRQAVVVPLAAPSDMAPAAAKDIERVQQRYSLPERFVLYVGTVEPRKDVARLADACRAEGASLVIAGGQFGADNYLPQHVRRLGFVPRADLPALYGAAAVVAYTSLYEGFGLPPLEAMACGAVVLCSRVASLPELLRDAVIWTRPGDLKGMRVGLREGLWDADVRARTRAETPAALQRTSWQSTARLLQDIYRSLV